MTDPGDPQRRMLIETDAVLELMQAAAAAAAPDAAWSGAFDTFLAVTDTPERYARCVFILSRFAGHYMQRLAAVHGQTLEQMLQEARLAAMDLADEPPRPAPTDPADRNERHGRRQDH